MQHAKNEILAILVIVFAGFTYAQSPTANAKGPRCKVQSDCPANIPCEMPDHNVVQMWPPCPHVGFCSCVKLSNGTCVPYVQLNLYDKCSNQAWERLRTPEQRCDGSKVICNSPSYIDMTGYCIMAPIPLVTVTPYTGCSIVDETQSCNNKTTCCDKSRGLVCKGQGQCQCAIVTDFYDKGLSLCRPRIYGDDCATDDDCKSGLIANTGFECRLKQCRCKTGFEPVDNLYWNETSSTSYTRRICVSNQAATFVPTGGSCTLNPHLFANNNRTRVCHPGAFCHLCYDERQSGTSAVNGICRELVCRSDFDCGLDGVCNTFSAIVDPPCEHGICDCKSTDLFYKDRYSGCSPMRHLWYGDRCLPYPNGLHDWYVNNENWDETMECVADNEGSSLGKIKCKSSTEFVRLGKDDTCLRNDINRLSKYQEACDTANKCDLSKGLVCLNNICQCPGVMSCANSNYSTCASRTLTSPALWDGTTCRAKNFGDDCNTSADCCSRQCSQGWCTCPSGTAPQVINTPNIHNGLDPSTPYITMAYCVNTSAAVVGKGQPCHLDAATKQCQQNKGLQICLSELVCLRCPADFKPDDENMGICRSVVTAWIPAGSCGKTELNNALSRNQMWSGAGWNTWTQPVVSAWNTWTQPWNGAGWNTWTQPVAWAVTTWTAPNNNAVWTVWNNPSVTSWTAPNWAGTNWVASNPSSGSWAATWTPSTWSSSSWSPTWGSWAQPSGSWTNNPSVVVPIWTGGSSSNQGSNSWNK